MAVLSNFLVAIGLVFLTHSYVPAFLFQNPSIGQLVQPAANTLNPPPPSPSNATVTNASPANNSVYSAHEHSALHSTAALHASSSSIPSLPADVVAETLLSVLLVAAGIVLSSAPLKPIQWSRWAGEAEREEARRRIGKGRKIDVTQGEVPGGNPFAWITEDRMGFWDGRGKRQSFANWVREGGRS
ncbi:hypothetical protein SLS58_009268 [Diplodia intermedia]|uniref:Transmembrane protein 32 protein n=1 Tax=Diplodia intermedia TaxID=856260 RepID=A0ABR3TDC8_9PEZI